jgi:hypothetical protein
MKIILNPTNAEEIIGGFPSEQRVAEGCEYTVPNKFKITERMAAGEPGIFFVENWHQQNCLEEIVIKLKSFFVLFWV